jgi:hypothetical protein
MNARYLQRALWASAAALSVGAVAGWMDGTPHVALPEHRAIARQAAAAIPHIVAGDVIDDAAGATSDHDPFRLTREPSAVPYDAGQDGPPVTAPPPPPKPPLALSGIVGPPWVAVLEGVPGRTGSVLAKPGDTLSRLPLTLLILHRIWHDTVVVRGADTTWTLTVRHPWR